MFRSDCLDAQAGLVSFVYGWVAGWEEGVGKQRLFFPTVGYFSSVWLASQKLDLKTKLYMDLC